MRAAALLAALACVSVAAGDPADELPRVLFLTHSAGFQHGVVKRPAPDESSHAEEQFVEAGRGRFDVRSTQDCNVLGDDLSDYDAVVFYTTGELPVAEGVRDRLLDYVRAGGAFVGVHCATDTFYEYPPYQEMVGGVFDGHPWHEEIAVRVEDADHPATAHLEDGFTITDEIYQFRDFARHPVRVLLSLDGDSVDVGKGKRADGDYALAWCRDYGEGRVFYTALGHRPEVWEDVRFREHLLGGIGWAIGGPDHAAGPPPDAVVLLGDDAASAGDTWDHRGGQPFAWQPVEEQAVEVVAGTGDLVSRATFGDVLLHVEFRTPHEPPDVIGQARGNSGVYLHARYEVQVLDSYGLEPDLGDCGAIYGLKVPDRNASRPPGRWQSYDIRFRAPRFGDSGAKSEDARLSVWHNGLRIHDDVAVVRPTRAGAGVDEVPTGPLLLQDHGNKVRYRNVWYVPLDD